MSTSTLRNGRFTSSTRRPSLNEYALQFNSLSLSKLPLAHSKHRSALLSASGEIANITQTLLTQHLHPITTPAQAQSSKGKQRVIDLEQGEDDDDPNSQGKETPQMQSSSKHKVYPHYKVRTSLTDRTLDSMFPVTNPTQISKFRETQGQTAVERTSSRTQSKLSSDAGTKVIRQSECFLTSVRSLRKEVEKARHNRMSLPCSSYEY